jgi:methylated-DNA-[protein]-cysteine S-methyltransferase
MNANHSQTWSRCQTPLGRLTITASDDGLDGLFFPGRSPALDEANRCPERFEQIAEQLEEYFAGARQRFEVDLDLSCGTPFQRSVWQQLQSLPYGETVSYSQLALRLGRLDRVRAVGAAVGRTPVPIIVACHRVIGSDGRLTGYIGGLQRKQALLDMEAAVRDGRGVPTSLGPRQLALL